MFNFAVLKMLSCLVLIILGNISMQIADFFTLPKSVSTHLPTYFVPSTLEKAMGTDD